MADVTMSLDEYEQMRSMAMATTCPGCSAGATADSSPAVTKKRRTRKKSSSDKKMSVALKEATAKAKKKNGSFKKGWNQSKLMKEAHRLKKRM